MRIDPQSSKDINIGQLYWSKWSKLEMGFNLYKALCLQISYISWIIGHCHDTRGFGLANVVAAPSEDEMTFDAPMIGVGGCQYAPAVYENIVAEN